VPGTAILLACEPSGLPEPVTRKRVRPVPRGRGRGNASSLPDERWFGLLTDKKLRRSAHRSIQSLEKDIREWIARWNADPKPFIWTKTADEILDRLASYLQRIPGAGH
jgi:hypothetical protein